MGVTARSIHGIGVCFIPKPENGHRPLALRHKPLAFVSVLLILTKLAALSTVSLVPAQAELSTITVDRIVQLTNAERQKANLVPLKVDSKLALAAKQKGDHMLQEDYFAHISPSGVTPWFWMSKVGYTYQVAGENLAIDFIEAEDVVAAWLASPSHKANMLHSSYTETGVSVVSGEFQGSTSIIVVHMFALPATSQVAAEIIETTPTPTPSSPPPTPTPSSTPAPAPIPQTTPPTDATPPRTPRIVSADNQTTFGSLARVVITGEPDSTAHVLVNNQLRANVVLPAAGTIRTEIDITDMADGTLVLRAYGTDAASNESALSDPLVVTKDTEGAPLPREAFVFALSPAFDKKYVAIQFTAGDFTTVQAHSADLTVLLDRTWSAVPITESLALEATDDVGNTSTLSDLHIAPQLDIDSRPQELEVPGWFNQLSRRMAAAVLVTVLILLSLAMLIRIRIQHPALITHASLVILLAAALFLL